MTSSGQRAVIISLIILGVVIVGLFGLRTFHAFREFRGHRPPPPRGEHVETDVELIRDWMTIPYLSITYRLPPNLLYKTLEIPPKGNEHKSLKQLNEKYYPEAAGIVLEKVKAAILEYQSTLTTIPPSSPSPTTNP
jgi:hypothetical protein